MIPWESQLSGCTVALLFDKPHAERVIHLLSTCDTHFGVHHFAVFDDGRGIAMSTNAVECINEHKLFPENIPTTATIDGE
jgi:hypothetical protein